MKDGETELEEGKLSHMGIHERGRQRGGRRLDLTEAAVQHSDGDGLPPLKHFDNVDVELASLPAR